MAQQKQSYLSQIGTSQQERPGPTGTPGEVLSLPCLSQGSEDQQRSPKRKRKMGDQESIHCKASYASLVSLSVGSYLCSLQTSHILPWVSAYHIHLSQQNCTWVRISWHHCIRRLARVFGSSKKPPEHHQKFYGVCGFLSMRPWQIMTLTKRQGIIIPSSITHHPFGPSYIMCPYMCWL